jgi:hypothetical protein
MVWHLRFSWRQVLWDATPYSLGMTTHNTTIWTQVESTDVTSQSTGELWTCINVKWFSGALSAVTEDFFFCLHFISYSVSEAIFMKQLPECNTELKKNKQCWYTAGPNKCLCPYVCVCLYVCLCRLLGSEVNRNAPVCWSR